MYQSWIDDKIYEKLLVEYFELKTNALSLTQYVRGTPVEEDAHALTNYFIKNTTRCGRK